MCYIAELRNSFPNLKGNAQAVERARLPSRALKKIPLQFLTKTQSGPSHIPKLRTPPIPTVTFERNLQIICGPGPQHQDFVAQQPHIKYKSFIIAGEQKWRPAEEILKESVAGSEDTSLQWSDFL